MFPRALPPSYYVVLTMDRASDKVEPRPIPSNTAFFPDVMKLPVMLGAPLISGILEVRSWIIKKQEAHWTALPVKQYLLQGFFLPKGINNRENFGGF